MSKKQKETAPVPPAEKKPRKDHRIEEIYEEIVEFICPVRGKVKQKVKIKRLKTRLDIGYQASPVPLKDPLEEIEATDDGLAIYNGEDLGISENPDDPQDLD
jgi:hypothetical protein